MSIIYHKKYHALIEALGILSRYYNNENFALLKERFQKRSSYTSDMEDVLRVMEKVYQETIKTIRFPKELAIYFEPIDNLIGNDLANVMLHEVLLTDENVDIQEYAIQCFHKDSSCFIHALLDIDEPMKIDYSPQNFMRELENMDITDSMKWNVWCVYTNYDEHLEKIMSVVQPLIEKIHEVYPRYENKFEKFHNYWENACKDGSFYERLKTCTNIEVFQNDNISIYPNYMMCNSVRLYDAYDSSNHINLFLGLLFQGKNFIDGNHFSREEILAELKLLSDASKYELMVHLKDKSQYGFQLAEHMHLSTATISHHVNSLCSHGLLNVEKDSNRVYYQLNKTQISFLLDALRKDLLEEV